jgi:hypothetical protein
MLCPREESNFDYKIRNLASYPLNDEGSSWNGCGVTFAEGTLRDGKSNPASIPLLRQMILETEESFNGVDERGLVLDLLQYGLQIRTQFH